MKTVNVFTFEGTQGIRQESLDSERGEAYVLDYNYVFVFFFFFVSVYARWWPERVLEFSVFGSEWDEIGTFGGQYLIFFLLMK